MVAMAGLIAIVLVVSQTSSVWAAQRRTGAAGTTEATVWLCQPGLANDPCTPNLTATSVSAKGTTSVVPNTVAPSSKFDCFYLYPTVSPQKTANANLRIQPAEIGVATAQAAQFSKVCNVWAPMYRQRTSVDLAKGLGADPRADQVAYRSVLSAWRDYLAHDNDGRPIIFIGHSQGAAMLIRLLRAEIDPSAQLRHQMVSAIILGGNVEEPINRSTGGSFEHIATCSSPAQVGCVIAYSTFSSPPPATSYFGRPGQGVSLQSGQRRSLGRRVACVNPVTFNSSVAVLAPYFLTATAPTPGVSVSTPWVTFPNLYTARCISAGGATWLQITTLHNAGDPRPSVTQQLGPNWGLHLNDVNLALGNLVHDVTLEEAAYR